MTFTSLIEIVDSTLKDFNDPLKPVKISVFDDLQSEETRRSFAKLLTNQNLFKFKEPELISFYNECIKDQVNSVTTIDRHARPRSKTIHSLIKAAAILKTPAAGVIVMNTSSVGIRGLQRYEILDDLVLKLYGAPNNTTLAFRGTYAEVDRALLSMWAYIFTTWMEQDSGRKGQLVQRRASSTTIEHNGMVYFMAPKRHFEGVFISRRAKTSP
ncbi:11140_t:CDS:2 [Acaulospora colombiana]|uniref:11140_t:CDS:1 n=1 Tax=Acaulospora colombiana TaxID=27376 RepID=A0ACA9MZC7_9GLOM|nr:11140_t:CDS:2 [Acaulospora colombiana]